MTFTFWESSLAGDKPEIHADAPQNGYYRARLGVAYLPVAIWGDEPGLYCRVGYDDCFNLKYDDDINAIWLRCADEPVSYAAYLTACRTHQWPEIGEALGLFELAETLLSGECEDGGELETLSAKLEAARKAEKAQHNEAGRVVDAKFSQWQDKIKAALKALKLKEQAA